MRSIVVLAAAVDPRAGIVLLGKVTMLLAGAALLATLLRHRSAAARHFVWAMALAGVVAVAVLIPVAPSVAVSVPRALVASGLVPVTPNVAGTGSAAFTVADDLSTSRAELPDVSTADEAGPSHSGARLPLGALAVLLWLTGGAIVLSWYGLGHVGLARLSRRATPVSDREWLALLGRTAARSGVSRAVRLLSSPAVGAPITWGLRRPVILLPVDAGTWSDERRSVVLVHELAHIARRDYLVQLMSSIACAVYWFHPAIWAAARRLRGESERACDDRVLASGTAAPDYAAHLLSVARGSRALRLSGAVAIGMARRSTLEGRLLAMLDETIARHPLSARTCRASAAALGMLLLPLAGMQPVNAAAVEERPATDGVTSTTGQPAMTAMLPQESVTRVDAAVVDSVVERTLTASPGERLTLDLQTGGDIDVEGWDQSRVLVRARLAGANWRDETVDIARDGNGVVVTLDRASRRSNTEASNVLEIRVPRRFDVRVSSAGGEISIVDVEGSFSGRSGGGGIVLERVHGTSSLTTGGGDIRVVDSELDGTVRTGGGMVRISNVRGNLKGSSGSGPVVYAEPTRGGSGERQTGDIGDVRVDRSNTRVTDERREATATIREAEQERVRERDRTRAEETRTREEEQKLRERTRDEEVRSRERERDEEIKQRERERAGEEQDKTRERIREEQDKTRERMREEQDKTRERAREEIVSTRERTRDEQTTARERAREEEVRNREQDRRADRGVATTREADRGFATTREEAVNTGDRGALNIRKAGGDVDLAAAPYGARIFTGGGRVTVGRSSGMVDAGTGGGDVRIGPVAGSVRATTGSGTVEVTLADANGDDQNVDIQSGSGRVIVYLPTDFEGRFEVETAYTRSFGRATRIDTDFDLRREASDEWDAREGTPRRYVRALGRVGRGGGTIYIKTVNGDVEIRKSRK